MYPTLATTKDSLRETQRTPISLGEQVGACQRGAPSSRFVMVLMLLFAWGCKPANEPTRSEEPSPAPDVAQASPQHSHDTAVAALGSLRVVMQNDPVLPRDEVDQARDQADPGVATKEPIASEDRRLEPEELENRIERARVPARPEDESAAQQLNAQGLKHHKRLDLSKAAAQYRAALRAWPGHLYARYNLACALQLQRRPQEAVDHLAILAGLQDRGGLDLLREARLDEDFSGAREDLRFRQLTGYVPVEVSAGVDGASRLTENGDALALLELPGDAPPLKEPTSTPSCAGRFVKGFGGGDP